MDKTTNHTDCLYKKRYGWHSFSVEDLRDISRPNTRETNESVAHFYRKRQSTCFIP